jgi:hypothetical protein
MDELEVAVELPESFNETQEESDAFAEGFTLGDESSEEAIQQVIEANPTLSEEQVRNLFEQNNQRLFGKLGEYNRSLQEVRQIASQAQQYVPQNVQVTADNFGRMREEFGDDFAAALAQDLSQIQMQSVQHGFNQAQIDEYISERLNGERQTFETKLVSMTHPDWQQVVGTKEFMEWKGKQPDEIRQMLDTSWDSEFLTTAIGAFKHQQAKQQSVSQKRTSRLANAVTPTSGGSISSDDFEDDFEAGFNSI